MSATCSWTAARSSCRLAVATRLGPRNRAGHLESPRAVRDARVGMFQAGLRLACGAKPIQGLFPFDYHCGCSPVSGAVGAHKTRCSPITLPREAPLAAAGYALHAVPAARGTVYTLAGRKSGEVPFRR